MDFYGPDFVIAIIAMSFGAWIITSWIRAKHGYPIENEWGGTTQKQDPEADRTIGLLSADNEQLHGKVGRLEERIAVLERIVTDRAHSLTEEIEALRSPAN